ncbi:MAG: hypothetical protein KAJ73_00375 [Zetaproteobacteria bacterium]|nr:hypothetical protein [Zetaproteobacteria bacterium]
MPFMSSVNSNKHAGYTPPPPGLDSILMMDGNTIEDVSPQAHGITTVGDVTISSEKAKFGTTSMKFNGGHLLVDDSANWTLGTDEWTLDFWVNLDVFEGYKRFFTLEGPELVSSMHYHGASIGYCFQIGAANDYNGSAEYGAADVWLHNALVREGDVWTQYLNGTATGDTFTAVGLSLGNPSSISLGLAGSGWTGDMYAHIDYLRFTRGVARWSTNFTPPGIGDY